MYPKCVKCDVLAFVNDPDRITLKNKNHFLDKFPRGSLYNYLHYADEEYRISRAFYPVNNVRLRRYDKRAVGVCPVHYGAKNNYFMAFIPFGGYIDKFTSCAEGRIVPNYETRGDRIEEIVKEKILKPYCLKNNYPFLSRFNWMDPCGKSCDACKNPCTDFGRFDQINGHCVPYLRKKDGFLYLPKKYRKSVNASYKDFSGKRNLTGGKYWDKWLCSTSLKLDSHYNYRHIPGKGFVTGQVDFVFRKDRKSIIIDVTNFKRYGSTIVGKVQKGYSAFCNEFWIILTNRKLKVPKATVKPLPKNVKLLHLHSLEVAKMFGSVIQDYTQILREIDSLNW